MGLKLGRRLPSRKWTEVPSIFFGYDISERWIYYNQPPMDVWLSVGATAVFNVRV